MNRRQLVVVVIFLSGLIAIILFPPYFGIDITSNGQIHGPVGYFPVWEPPTPEHALAILSESGVIPDGGVLAADLAVRRNVVGLVLSSIGLFLLCLIGFGLLRTRGGRGHSEGHAVGASG